jgi:hypothetical protein
MLKIAQQCSLSALAYSKIWSFNYFFSFLHYLSKISPLLCFLHFMQTRFHPTSELEIKYFPYITFHGFSSISHYCPPFPVTLLTNIFLNDKMATLPPLIRQLSTHKSGWNCDPFSSFNGTALV